MNHKVSGRISRLFSINDGIELSENKERYWNQCLVGFVAASAMLNCGIQFSWFGPAIPILQNPELSPIGVVTSTEASWINSFLQLGTLPGALLGSYLANNIGRKNTLVLTAIPTSLSYFLIIFVKNVYMFYAARILGGLCVGITFVVVPTYLTEISSPKIRGILGTFTFIIMSTISMVQNILQPIMTIQLNSIIGCILSFVHYSAVLYFLPETPHYYIMKDKEELAKQSLQKLRQCVNVENELLQIKESRTLEKRNQLSFCEYLQTKIIRKSMIILFVSIAAQQFSGPFAVGGYIPTILNESIPMVPTYYGSLAVIICGILGTCLSMLFIDNFGRRFLFITSGIAISIVTCLIGLYYVFESMYGIQIVSQYSVTLFVLLSCYIVIFAFGQITLANIYVGELFETHFRTIAALISTVACAALGFIIIQLYGVIYRNFGLQYIYLFFTICSILCTLSGYYLLPETKGRSLQEIHESLVS